MINCLIVWLVCLQNLGVVGWGFCFCFFCSFVYFLWADSISLTSQKDYLCKMLMYIVSFITSKKWTNVHFAVFVPSPTFANLRVEGDISLLF